MLTTACLAAVALASPRFAEVRPCPDTAPWQSALWEDPAEAPFAAEPFVPAAEWPEAGGAVGAAQIRACFGEAAPHNRRVVLHFLDRAPGTPARPRPVLLVGGAADNALRSMTVLAESLSAAGFPVYALTFAHTQGDNYAQAEHVANAIAVMKARHGAEQVDVVAHSKGGVAARIYTSHLAAADFAEAAPAYAANGTRYRGDVARLVLLGAPNAGVDTVLRWPAQNLIAAADPASWPAPTSWDAHYPLGTANLLVYTDLSDWAIDGPAFRGQAQLLADLRGLYVLPGENPMLGAYALQQDWYTTYEGGVGFVSTAPGIVAAVEAGGHTIETLQRLGVAPDVSLYLAAGGNPIVRIGGRYGAASLSGWGDFTESQFGDAFEEWMTAWFEVTFPWYEAFSADLPRLYAGTAYLGEVSGPSDGAVFQASALDETGLTARGAVVAETKVFDALGHLELIVAGERAAAEALEEDAALAEKYAVPENQAVEWIVGVLSAGGGEEPPPADGGVPADGGAPTDGGAPADGGTGPTIDAAPATDARPADTDAAPGDEDAAPGPDDAALPTTDFGRTPEPDASEVSGTAADDGCTAAPGARRGLGGLALAAALLALRRRRRSPPENG